MKTNKLAVLFLLIGTAFLIVPFCGTKTEWCFIISAAFFFSSVIIFLNHLFFRITKEEPKQEESKYNYTVITKVIDNKTGKHADITMSGNDPAKLSGGLDKFVQASCIMVNMDDQELKEVSVMIQQKITEQKS